MRGQGALLLAVATALAGCGTGPSDRSWQAHPGSASFVQVEPFTEVCDTCWLAWAFRPSPFDAEVAPRPLVFRIDGTEAVDVWRGTSLSRPTVAAGLVTVGDHAVLCALHRADTYLRPDPSTQGRLLQAYRWEGPDRAFVGVDDPAETAACESLTLDEWRPR